VRAEVGMDHGDDDDATDRHNLCSLFMLHMI